PKNRRTWSIVILAAFVATALCSETYRVCFKYPTHQLNPYAYSSTAPDINRLVERLEELAATNPRGKNILIQVVSKDYWPLPWYLRKFPNVGYWNEVPATLPGDAILTSPSENEEIQRRMPKDYQVEFFGLRTDVLILLYSKAPSQDR
ncbi:MAG TPA: hypothetical protein VKC60_17170, partial [Opitutaceae bacterium]|nr:hypothetical protein [Opitutaceae bacterium]